MTTLHVRGGELEGQGSWIYAWLADHGVVYVGGTGLHPATRTWLHLHHDDPEIGRMLARYPTLADEELEVVFMELAEGVERQRVRHGTVTKLGERGLLSERHVCDPPPDLGPSEDADRFVGLIAERMAR
ncbi:MAG: hypothetical protein ACRDNB_12440 [Gaiellaceae bacterium]